MNIVSTQQPFNIYRHLFAALGNYADVEIVERLSDLDSADMVFHCPPTFDYLEKYSDYSFKLYREQLEKRILTLNCVKDADIYPGDAYNDIRHIVPVVEQLPAFGWVPEFPSVFKRKGSSGGSGIIHVTNEDQYRKLFDPSYITEEYYAEVLSGLQLNLSDYTVSRFRECPSGRYTHYRIITLGTGKILGAGLFYSGHSKGRNRGYDEVWDDPNSPLFLDRQNVCSNFALGGGGIIPFGQDETLSELEQEIFDAHNILSVDLPSKLKSLSQKTAQLLSMRGLYLLGQDWIQEGDTYTLMEVNRYPGLELFKHVHGFNNEQSMDYLAREIVGSLSIK